MGTACIPSYANIFMARFEQKHIYPFVKGKVGLNLIYIDDDDDDDDDELFWWYG